MKMIYEKPQLIRLTGELWDAGGTCANGQSNPSGDCIGTGLHAPNGECNPGDGPDPNKLCTNVGAYAGGPVPGCAGGFFAGGTPTCNPNGAAGNCGFGGGAT